MSRVLALILSAVEGLALLASASAVAQQVPNPMSKDAANAQLPAARQNLEIGTVKSVGGSPPDAGTKFYTWDGAHTMFEVAAAPNANEWAVEQAGITGYGATRLCYSDSSTVVNCNYVALSKNGRHIFGNGAGKLLQLGYAGTGPVNAFPMLYSGDDLQIRLYAEVDGGYPNAGVYIKSKGVADVVIGNDGAVNIARFTGAASAPGAFAFAAPTVGGAPATISSTAYGVYVANQRLPTRQTNANYTIPDTESGMQYHNAGAGGGVTYTLPPAAQGLNYCFSVEATFALVVQAAGSDRIAIGGSNSVAGGQVSASAQHASLCLVAYRAGQWVTRSTADNTQWTVT